MERLRATCPQVDFLIINDCSTDRSAELLAEHGYPFLDLPVNLGIGGGIGEKKYDLGFNRATSPHQTGSTMKPIGAYALALDYKLINYSSQILDSPYYSAEDKKVLKDQYIGVMSPFSEAAQSRSDVWRAWPSPGASP